MQLFNDIDATNYPSKIKIYKQFHCLTELRISIKYKTKN